MQLERVGLQKTTLIDYPGLVASTVFTHGCNLRCPYCHNPELVTGHPPAEFISREVFFTFLEKRKKVLDGVCITGGEPLLYDDLPEFIEQIRHYGLKVKLDTNGLLPDKLKSAKVDYIAMDLKTVPSKYGRLTSGILGVSGTKNISADINNSISEKILESLDYLKHSKIEHETRTTWVPGINNLEDIPEMARLLKGVQRYYITPFRPGVTLDPLFSSKVPGTHINLKEVQQIFKKNGISALIRNER